MTQADELTAARWQKLAQRFEPLRPKDLATDRTELAQKIIASARKRVVLMSAPAGHGKTALLSDLSQTFRSNGKAVIAIDCDYHEADEIKIVFDEMRLGVPSKLVISFDNIHSLTARQAGTLGRLLSRYSGEGAILLAGRGHGHLSIEALKMERRLDVYDQKRLAFSMPELLSLSTLLAKQGNSDPAVMLERTEGWIIAINAFLDEQAERQVGIPPGLIRYFDETFFAHLPAKVQDALCATSILDSFTAASFKAVSGGLSWSHALRDTLPVCATEGSVNEWRYHPLYRGFLRSKISVGTPPEYTGAHNRAASWFREAGDHYRAASHAIETGDRQFTTSILDLGARHFIATGRIADAITWLDYLKDMDSDLALHIRVFHVTALILSRRTAEARMQHEGLIELVRLQRTESEPASWVDEVDAHNRFHDCLFQFYDPGAPMDRSAIQQIVSDYSKSDFVVGGEAGMLVGLLDLREGRVEDAEAIFLGVLEPLRRTASWLALAYAYTALASIDCWRRSTANAIERLEGFLEDLADAGVQGSPVESYITGHLAQYHLVAGNAQQAEALLQNVARSAAQILDSEKDAQLMLLSASVYAARDQRDKAREILLKASGLTDLDPYVVRRINLALARHYLTDSDIVRARSLLPVRGMGPMPHERASDEVQIAMAEHLLDMQIALTGSEDAQISVGRLLVKRVRTLGIQTLLVEALCTLSVALAQDNLKDEAMRTLREAVEITQRGACPQVLIDFPLPGMRQLLNTMMATGEESQVEFLSSALERKAQEPGTEANILGSQSTITDNFLTAKEQEVLLRIALGHSNQRIADSLVISLATAKWHVRNILSKLDANSRSSAVAKARLANLIN